MLRDLDEAGVIRIGATIKQGDILVGKVTPKGETQLTPEEKLLRAIFGEKAGDVRDASLYCPPGIEGMIVDVKIFSRKGQEKDERAKPIEAHADREAREEPGGRNPNSDRRAPEASGSHSGQQGSSGRPARRAHQQAPADQGRDSRPRHDRAHLDPQPEAHQVRRQGSARERADRRDRRDDLAPDRRAAARSPTRRIDKLHKGDELPPGVIKLVKVYIAMKRKLTVGDKMAGRHGNKGVIARILPEEDMPYLADGTPVEIVLNPLGVPSRMNVGQILETHLGWAGHELGKKIAELLKENTREEAIRRELKSTVQGHAAGDKIADTRRRRADAVAQTLEERHLLRHRRCSTARAKPRSRRCSSEAGLPTSGKTALYDGMTGDKFEQPVTVGYIYMLKLSHLVDDKIHARSIGPYSLITQQPLGGKAQFGGQRFGEMEVWALEAYGAAYILQELLTAKSDDVYGRTKIYEAIVKGEAAIEPGVPESFNVLIRELQSLCLDVELIKAEREEAGAGSRSS